MDLSARDPRVLREDFDDRLALLLDDLGATAVEHDAPGEWRVFFGDDAARDEAAAALAQALDAECEVAPVDVPDEGWATAVQATLTAVRVGRVIVAPPWDVPARAMHAAASAGPPPILHRSDHNPAPNAGATLAVPGDIVVVIEPSMGFGTGHHQSTRLCLSVLQRLQVAGASVIDVGTGSGVLALAALALGASSALAVDYDPDATASVRTNACLNGIERGLSVHQADLAWFSAPPADIVLANLTATLLDRFAAAIVPLVSPGGVLVASGFTHDQVAFVRDSFSHLRCLTQDEEDDWVALTFAAGD